MGSLNVSLHYLLKVPMSHDKAFQNGLTNKQKKQYRLALEAFDSGTAVGCSREVGEYKKVHDGGTSTIQG